MEQSHHDLIMRELFGGPPKVRAIFSLSAVFDPKASEATGLRTTVDELTPEVLANPESPEGFRVYRDEVVVEEHAEGEKDFMSFKATAEHKARYPQEWARFEEQRKRNAHDVRLSPGCTPAVVATLEGIGIRTLEGLAAFDKPLPEFIEKHRAFAKRFLAFINGVKPKYRLVDGAYVEAA